MDLIGIGFLFHRGKAKLMPKKQAHLVSGESDIPCPLGGRFVVTLLNRSMERANGGEQSK